MATLRVLGAGIAALALAGCTTSQTPAERVPIAFEGFVGVPAAAGSRVALELAQAAADRRVQIVRGDDPAARFTMRGYLAPVTQGPTTSVSYVWDVFDRSGRRAQRAAGEITIPAAGAHEWAVLEGGGARLLAASSLAAIERLVTASPEAPSQPASAAAPAAASRAESAEAARAAVRRRIAVGAIAGLDQGHGAALRAAMRRSLGELGFDVVESGAEFELRAEATINPPEAGRERVAVIWNVVDGAGRPVGEVRQMARLREGSVQRTGEATWRRAVEAALPGIVALVPARP
jgi:hypothetical protein